jgi:hypothetical protein
LTGHYEYEIRREHLAHQGAQFLAKALARGTVEAYRDVVRDTYATMLMPNFDQSLEELDCDDRYGLIPPALKYENPDILAKLFQLPESEQPSRGWKWFCHKYDIESYGIRLERWVEGNSAWDIRRHSIEYELGWGYPYWGYPYWGYPYWDKEKVEKWGVIMSSPLKKKKNKKSKIVAEVLEETSDAKT